MRQQSRAISFATIVGFWEATSWYSNGSASRLNSIVRPVRYVELGGIAACGRADRRPAWWLNTPRSASAFAIRKMDATGRRGVHAGPGGACCRGHLLMPPSQSLGHIELRRESATLPQSPVPPLGAGRRAAGNLYADIIGWVCGYIDGTDLCGPRSSGTRGCFLIRTPEADSGKHMRTRQAPAPP